MVERYAISQYEQAARLLPVRWQRIALQLPDWQKEQVEELRLRAGHPMTVLLPRGEQVVGEEAVVTQGDIELLCDTVTGYSRYAAAETMARGYITAKGGFRIGLCGTAVVQEGRSTNLRSLSSALPGKCRAWQMTWHPNYFRMARFAAHSSLLRRALAKPRSCGI